MHKNISICCKLFLKILNFISLMEEAGGWGRSQTCRQALSSTDLLIKQQNLIKAIIRHNKKGPEEIEIMVGGNVKRKKLKKRKR